MSLAPPPLRSPLLADLAGTDSLPLALFTNGFRISKLVDSYDPRLIEAKEQASRAAKAVTLRFHDGYVMVA